MSRQTSGMRVWIVRWDYYDEWDVEAVFDSEAGAQAYAAHLNGPDRDDKLRLGEASVQAFEVQTATVLSDDTPPAERGRASDDASSQAACSHPSSPCCLHGTGDPEAATGPFVTTDQAEETP